MKNEYLKNCEVCDAPIGGQKVKYCSNKCKQKANWDRVKIQPNTYHSQTKRAIERKLKLIELRGGGCEVCGYDKNVGAIDFHHIDPSIKDDNVNTIARTRGKQALSDEIAKCIILCKNCHADFHHLERTSSITIFDYLPNLPRTV
jgi:hypothetical protein